MGEHEAFFEMVKAWTESDYRTQEIKAEVIVDMLLSEFIEEIVACGLDEDVRNIRLIAKEFPLKPFRGKEKEYRHASIDYVLGNTGNHHLYLVELKTTNSSFAAFQLLNMLQACDKGITAFLQFFEDIIRAKCQNRKTASGLHTKKYLHTLRRMNENLGFGKPVEAFRYGQVSGAYSRDNDRAKNDQKAAVLAVTEALKKAFPPAPSEEKRKEQMNIIYLSLQPINDDEREKAHRELDRYFKKNKIDFDWKEMERWEKNYLKPPIVLKEYLRQEDTRVAERIMDKAPWTAAGRRGQWEKTKEILRQLLPGEEEWFIPSGKECP